jgi:hypothetical protein
MYVLAAHVEKLFFSISKVEQVCNF